MEQPWYAHIVIQVGKQVTSPVRVQSCLLDMVAILIHRHQHAQRLLNVCEKETAVFSKQEDLLKTRQDFIKETWKFVSGNIS